MLPELLRDGGGGGVGFPHQALTRVHPGPSSCPLSLHCAPS
ncbi:unnamed protein product, partial [Gulo gulo]